MLDTVQVWSTDLFQNPHWSKSGDCNPSTGCYTISISVKRDQGCQGVSGTQEGASEDRVVLPAIPYIHTLSTAGTRQQQNALSSHKIPNPPPLGPPAEQGGVTTAG